MGTQSEQLRSSAFSEGRRAGLMRLAPSLNPYRDDDPMRLEWERGWRDGLTAKLRAA